MKGSQKSRPSRKAHRPTYAEDWSDDDVLDHPAVAWKSLQVHVMLLPCALLQAAFAMHATQHAMMSIAATH